MDAHDADVLDRINQSGIDDDNRGHNGRGEKLLLGTKYKKHLGVPSAFYCGSSSGMATSHSKPVTIHTHFNHLLGVQTQALVLIFLDLPSLRLRLFPLEEAWKLSSLFRPNLCS